MTIWVFHVCKVIKNIINKLQLTYNLKKLGGLCFRQNYPVIY